MSVISTAVAAGVPVVLLATAALVAYILGFVGLALQPVVIVAIAAVSAGLWSAIVLRPRPGLAGPTLTPAESDDPGVAVIAWAVVVLAVATALAVPSWPGLLPPGGGSDLAHHLMLVDVIDRTRHLVDARAAGPALGEMAHYTPGLHLLVVTLGGLTGVEAWRVAYPLVVATVALKAGFVFLIARRTLPSAGHRLALAVAAVALVLWAPRGYSVEGFLQAGFFAQVAAEVFAVAAWWAVLRWSVEPRFAWMACVGLMSAAVFLVWPIWLGPVMIAVGVTVLFARAVSPPTRAAALLVATGPVVLVAAMHLSRHAAWLGMAGVSGAVPDLSPGWPGWALIALALVGTLTPRPGEGRRVTLWFVGAVALQAVALLVLARARGAETPYMAMKMIYLGVYPVAVMGALGLATIATRLRVRTAAAAWLVAAVVAGLGARAVTSAPLPAPIVSPDLDAAGRWARANLPAGCVDYIVDNAEQAYWLHLAVMGQPRSSPRTADIDGYTPNRAAGRWIAGDGLPYAVARLDLLPGEILGDAEVIGRFGDAVVIRSPDADGCR